MTNEEFVDSLTPSQAKHFNAWMVSIREEYHAIYEKNAAELVGAKAGDLQKLADQIKTDAETHAKALEDAAKDKQLSLDAAKETHDKVVSQFAIDLEAQRKQASDEFDKRINELTTKQDDVVNSLVSNHNELVKVLNKELANLKNELLVKNERIDKLLIEVPFNPRLISTPAFLARIQDLIFTLSELASVDPVAKGFLTSLFIKKKDQDSIKLDSPKLTGALDYLISIGQLKPERAKDILRDCTRDEAFKPPIEATDEVIVEE